MATPAPSHTHLYGSCACERNQYAIAIPQIHTQNHTHAHVFFDNSRANRRSQATPLTAWLRVPLDWYHSNTQAYYPDESHAAIRRTFYTPASLTSANGSGGKEVRKQFCGYCGTHLSAWREDDGDKDWMDVTLGSLWSESLGVLENLGWLPDASSSGESSGSEEGEKGPSRQGRAVRAVPRHAHAMQNRGMPFFEEMVEDSRLGNIKRRRGTRVSADGSSTVTWEVTEMEEGGDEDTVMKGVIEGGGAAAAESGNGNKRLKLGD